MATAHPTDSADPVDRLAADLDLLRRGAGFSYRALARQAGCPVSTLNDALTGRRFPRLETVLAVARACGSDVTVWRHRWVEVDRARSQRRPATVRTRGAFRFLGEADPGLSGGRRIAELARRAESIGYSGLVMPDHLLEQHAPIPVLATVAAATERLRIGTFVCNVDLRHPAVLAQELASLDVLSGGRLEIGIGAGWNRSEYQALGLPYHPLGVRIDRLTEAIAVLKGCFSHGAFSYAGEHYDLSGHDGQPKPVQRPHPPFLVGGGSRRVLSLAARDADIVGLAPRVLLGDRTTPVVDPRSITLAATEEKLSWVRRSAGDRFDHLELNTYPSVAPAMITNRARAEAQAIADRLYRQSGIQLTPDQVLESPHAFIGTVATLTDKLLHLRDHLGITSVLLHPFEPLAPLVEALAGR